jgi:hypothetical protein
LTYPLLVVRSLVLRLDAQQTQAIADGGLIKFPEHPIQRLSPRVTSESLGLLRVKKHALLLIGRPTRCTAPVGSQRLCEKLRSVALERF